MAHTILYGIHAVQSALDYRSENVLTFYYQDNNDNNRYQALLTKAQALDIEVQRRSRPQLDELTECEYHQGVAIKVKVAAPLDEKGLYLALEKATTPPLLLILEGIQDPHNLGACLRSAEALGAHWVVITKANSAPLNATVSKVSCGADQIVPIVQIANLARFLNKIQELGVWTIGTAASAEKTLAQIDLKGPIAIVMGAEGKGLKRLTLETCDEMAKIPMIGVIDSLNVSVSAGICLYEVLRQRQSHER